MRYLDVNLPVKQNETFSSVILILWGMGVLRL